MKDSLNLCCSVSGIVMTTDLANFVALAELYMACPRQVILSRQVLTFYKATH